MENEEIAYEAVKLLIDTEISNDEGMSRDCDAKCSLLSTILNAKGLDMKDKISGVIGEFGKEKLRKL